MVEKGSITASCGCKLADDDEGVGIKFGDYDCDPIDGFQKVIIYAHYCTPCAEKAKSWDTYFETEEQANEWLAAPDELAE